MKLQRKWEELCHKQHLSHREECLQAAIAGVKALGVHRFVSEVRGGVINRDIYRQIVQGTNGFSPNGGPSHVTYAREVEKQIRDYYDLLFWNISLSPHASSSQGLAHIVSDDGANPFLAFFRTELAEEVYTLPLDIVGISIAAVNQVVPAFTFARVLKELSPETHIVLGGSWCTRVRLRLGPILDRFNYIDSMIVFEGEEPLLRLCRTLQEHGDLASIPNLYFKRRGAVVFTGRTGRTVKMTELPTPCFEGLPLDEYDEPHTLPLQATRGCYWGKCTFCSYTLLEPEYKARSASQVVADMVQLKSRCNASSFMLADAAVSPNYARQLAQALLSRGAVLGWVAFARFDTGFTPELLSLMARSGCQQISWGLESANRRVLQVINKSIAVKNAEGILRASADAGIRNRLLVMYGHPTEQSAEALETVDFVGRNIKQIHSLSWNYYHPERETGIEDLAHQHTLDLETDPGSDLSFGYLWKSELFEAEKEMIASHYRTLAERIRLRTDECEHDPSNFIELLASGSETTHHVPLPGRLHGTSVFSYLSHNGSEPHAKRKFIEIMEM